MDSALKTRTCRIIDDGDDGDGGGGVSRTFIIIAGVMILLFVLGLGAVLLISLNNNGPTPFEQTATAITNLNGTTQAELVLRETEGANEAATGTAFALLPTDTPTPAPTDTPTREPTVTPTPSLDPTQLAAFMLQTQQAFDTTQTAEALLSSPTVAPVDENSVAQTATALAILLAPGQGGGEVPTQEIFATAPTAGSPVGCQPPYRKPAFLTIWPPGTPTLA